MFDEGQRATSEETQSEVDAFREKIKKADGSLIPLRKTIDGKKLYATARFAKIPESGVNQDVDMGWWEGTNDALKYDGAMAIDVYQEDRSRMIPLGHMDWWMRGDYANGGGNMHSCFIPKNDHERLSKHMWHDETAFKVDYGYHRQNVGSFMIASSAIVLPAVGARVFYTGGMLEPAKKTYARFGITADDFPDTRTWDRHLPIERLAQSPQVNKSISEFV